MGLIKAKSTGIFGSAQCPSVYERRRDMDDTYKRWKTAIQEDPRTGAHLVMRELFGAREATKRADKWDEADGIVHEDEPQRKQPRLD